MNKKVKLYSIFIAFMPVISIYASGIKGLNAGDVILIIFFSLFFFDRIKRKRPLNFNSCTVFLVFVYVIVFLSGISLLFQGDSNQVTDILIRTVRFSFYVICIVFVSKQYFNWEIATKYVVRISILATLYIVIQYISYHGFNVMLKGFLPFIPVYTEAYIKVDYATLYSALFYRPTSIFLEPASLSQYALIGLAICILKHNNTIKRDYIIAVFITFGILLSTSSQGVLLSGIVWLIHGLKIVFNKTSLKNAVILLLIISILPFILISTYQTDIMQYTLSRMFNLSQEGAVAGRFSGFYAFNEIPNYLKLIGLGFGSDSSSNVWMSSAAQVLYGSGVIGLSISVYIFLKYTIKSKYSSSKVICLVFFLMYWGASIFHSYMVLFYFSFICYETYIDKKESDDGLPAFYNERNA